MDINKLKS